MTMGLTLTTKTSAETLLPNCPDSPNCVSSQAGDSHRIEPCCGRGVGKADHGKLRELLAGRSDTQLLRADEGTILVEFHTTLGFVDDAIFVLSEKDKVIHVRSAARTGYWDLGKNRRRLEEIRKELQEGG
jgi:uncharacterized protein (DUF1499 family)